MEMTQSDLELVTKAPERTTGRPVERVAFAAPHSLRLAELPTGAVARVVSVSAEAGGTGELHRRLAELGFLPGEKLRIVARGFLGREPIAVRIGTSTFALRLFEAACIGVCPEPSLQA
jgi:ferrous iron transport protein A